jgi:hypothetical protein
MLNQTISLTVNSLCEHPEYFEPLRAEIDQQPEMDFKTLESLPVLNSFMKEVIRTQPLDSGESGAKTVPLVDTEMPEFNSLNTSQSTQGTYLQRWTACSRWKYSMCPFLQHHERRRSLPKPASL